MYRYGTRVQLRRNLMRLRICGVQSVVERRFIRKGLDTYCFFIYEGRQHGVCFSIVVGAVLGNYTGGKLYKCTLVSRLAGLTLMETYPPSDSPAWNGVTAFCGFRWILVGASHDRLVHSHVCLWSHAPSKFPQRLFVASHLMQVCCANQWGLLLEEG
ncbi:hypothetical protein TraAM80_04872 [Trypanosoma rangeli]|uniref:Uncharacterized protein n=1 Tax=Trypanosoma rangeli TaxID=5698 RepID=A0A3R7ND61_TRYRA|nr:uncharacterized protein TraAM80_04872 [Trypanosoma rangeli]RNF04676.1 hypothetical protein TraAM80_04872 [Trypanosoma rangeli]|eukprot:RNF04676.1 hypothetical protein TraAM80_04872 [Trypanosoma rangeli]